MFRGDIVKDVSLKQSSFPETDIKRNLRTGGRFILYPARESCWKTLFNYRRLYFEILFVRHSGSGCYIIVKCIGTFGAQAVKIMKWVSKPINY